MTFTAYSSTSLTDYVSQGTISLPGGITSATYRDLFFTAAADLNVTRIESVPEPSTTALAGLGLLGLAGAWLRRKVRW